MILISGNDLASGAVTWWTGSGWSHHFGDAVDVGDGAAAIIAAEEAACRVNGAAAVEADASGMPSHIKDRIRAAGPSVRIDLGINPAVPAVLGA